VPVTRANEARAGNDRSGGGAARRRAQRRGAAVIDLGNAPNSVRLDGQAKNDQAASSLANVGDVNGDGHPDFIVGSPQSDSHARTDNGSAFVVYGGQGLAGVRHRKLGVDGFRIDGAAAGDLAGTAVAGAGDFNGDGIDDVIVGARLAGTNQVGAAYVIYGQRTDDLQNVDLAQIATTQAARGMEILGAAQFDNTGEAVGGGRDINFDQVDDVIVAAPSADNNDRLTSGSAYVIYGQQTADPADVDLTKIVNAQAGRGMEIDGAVPNDIAGFSVAMSRDLNDDGIADALIGAPGAGNNMRNQSGSVYVIYGMNGDDVPDVDLAKITSTQAASGMRIDGAGVLDGLGQSVAGDRDLNGDGIDDAIIGAPRNRNDAGAAYVIYGRPGDAPDVDLAKLGMTQNVRGMRILGAIGGIETGWIVDSGRDVNGDGRPDAIVTAPDASNNHFDSGAAYVIFGQQAADPKDVQLSKITTSQASRGLRIDGAARDDKAGFTAAASAGDLNADGPADVLVGTPFARNNGPDSGSAYVVDLKG
jgi:hypothetical protein